MRQIQYFLSMRATDNCAAYVLTAEGPIALGHTLPDYIEMAAARANPRRIRPLFSGKTFDKTGLYGQLIRRQNQQESPTFEKGYLNLLETGRLKGWSLTAVEVNPGELNLHLISHSLWARHDKAVKSYRLAHAGEPSCAKVSNAEITANLPPYHEVLTCRPIDAMFERGQSISITLDVPRLDVVDSDQYSVAFTSDQTIIGEPTGTANRCIVIDNTAFWREYAAQVIELQ